MQIRYATVNTVSNGKITVKFDGESTVSSKGYTYPKNSNPSIGDRAGFIVDDNKKYLCVGIY